MRAQKGRGRMLDVYFEIVQAMEDEMLNSPDIKTQLCILRHLNQRFLFPVEIYLSMSIVSSNSLQIPEDNQMTYTISNIHVHPSAISHLLRP